MTAMQFRRCSSHVRLLLYLDSLHRDSKDVRAGYATQLSRSFLAYFARQGWDWILGCVLFHGNDDNGDDGARVLRRGGG
jgi:hypothetical protein